MTIPKDTATPTESQLKVRELLANMSNVHPCSKLTFTGLGERAEELLKIGETMLDGGES